VVQKQRLETRGGVIDPATSSDPDGVRGSLKNRPHEELAGGVLLNWMGSRLGWWTEAVGSVRRRCDGVGEGWGWGCGAWWEVNDLIQLTLSNVLFTHYSNVG
jgi:hypothetical protein